LWLTYGCLMKRLKESAAMFVGSLLLALGRTENQLGSRLGLPPVIFLTTTVVGLVLIAGGLVGFFGARVVAWAKGLIERPPPNVNRPGFAEDCDLVELHRLYEDKFGPDIPSLEQMRKWHARNRRIFLKIAETDILTGRARIVASVKVVPLKSEVIPALDSEEVSGTRFVESHISEFGEVPRGWYIGDLVSTSRRSACAVMEALLVYLARNVIAETLIYARPLTDQGLHYVKRFGFKPVRGRDGEFGRIYRLSGAEVLRLAGGLRCVRRGEFPDEA
jgi:hypothetical protein